MGTGANQINVVYDTGSDHLAVETIDCKNCAANTYNPGTSMAFKKSNELCKEQLAYSSAKLLGCFCKDNVYLDPLKWFGVKDFDWFAVNSQSGIDENFDGILGLSFS